MIALCLWVLDKKLRNSTEIWRGIGIVLQTNPVHAQESHEKQMKKATEKLPNNEI